MNDAIAVALCFAGGYWLVLAWRVFLDRNRLGLKDAPRPQAEPRGLVGWIITIICLLGTGVSPYDSSSPGGSLGWFSAFAGLVFIGALFIAGGISLGLTS